MPRMHKVSNDWSIQQNNLQNWSFSDAIKQYIFFISRDLTVDPTADRQGSYRRGVIDRNSCLKLDRLLQLWMTHKSEGILRLNYDSRTKSNFHGLWKTQTLALHLSIRLFAFSQWCHICSRPNPLRAFEYAMSSKYIAPKTTLGLRISCWNFPHLSLKLWSSFFQVWGGFHEMWWFSSQYHFNSFTLM